MSSGLPERIASLVAAGATDPPSPHPAWLQRFQRGPVDVVFLADAILAIILFGTTDSWLETQNATHGHRYGTVTLLLFAFLASAPLLLRTRFPAAAWGAAAVALGWTSVAIGPRALPPAEYVPAGLLVYALCLYSVAVRGKPWFVAGVAVFTVVGAILIDARTSAGALLMAIPLLGGAIVRVRRSGRAELAQQTRRLEGERALLEERQRIARELHDIVAHHMSVIAIQAEAAPRRVADPPPELMESFADIRASALSGLGELRRLLGVLRSGGADTAPQPGLGELAGLLDSARSGGVRVSSAVSGTPRTLPDGVDLSAYRILQEALSNAMRHAPGSAVRVELAYAPSSVVIKVRNGAGPVEAATGGRSHPGAGAPWNSMRPGDPAGPDTGTGQGIIGMRERTAMLGGHLDAAPTEDGGFLVTAVLPEAQDPQEARP
ncbi:MAG: sensor histidine kinase [Streptosporangiaceae bacterium]